MRQTTGEQLRSYWASLKGGRIAPRRFDIEPSRIAALLPHTFILEQRPDRDYAYRLAGTALCDVLGGELRGASFLAGWTLPDALALEHGLAAVTGDGAVLRLGIAARSTSGQPLHLDGVLLPLLHTNGAIERVLGCLAPRVTPEWLGAERLTRLTVETLEVWPTDGPSTPRGPRPTVVRSVPIPEAHADGHGDGDRQPHASRTATGRPRLAVVAGRDTGRHVGRDAGGSDDGSGCDPRRRDHGGRLSATAVAPPQTAPPVRKARIVRSASRQFRVYDGDLGR